MKEVKLNEQMQTDGRVYLTEFADEDIICALLGEQMITIQVNADEAATNTKPYQWVNLKKEEVKQILRIMDERD